MSNSQTIQPKKVSTGVVVRRVRQQAKGLVFMALWITLLFVCAGRVDWIRGWICIAVYLVGVAATGMIVHHANHELLERRAQWQHKDTKGFDKIFLAIFFPLTVIQPAVAGLDVVRFHWSAMPSWTILPAAGLFLLAMALITWTLATNPFAESTVRIQSERSQSVIRSGPYAVVRHPMYVGMILMYLATGWMLGSTAALIFGIPMAVLLIIRTGLEDRTLRHELPGYADYSLVTRYRLLPGIW
ncbi:MAG TPA: isoprenylcysteine carboxylmethyltransferase family protein [Verrucomicrobiae bacterium]|jgi:protein-S-isoprenylcysteine O-methyltransferase Ste14|nr:isoprenylcysteine carboxylmethyltransferase family protein [Verrucomicrobiae bacterium]